MDWLRIGKFLLVDLICTIVIVKFLRPQKRISETGFWSPMITALGMFSRRVNKLMGYYISGVSS